MDDLFPGLELPLFSCPYQVVLHNIHTPLDHYEVRLWLLSQPWDEFEEWHIDFGKKYIIWFKDIGKAIYFKLSYVHDPRNFRSKL